MTLIIFHLKSGRHLRVLPDTLIEMDGHPIISYTYSIFKFNGQQSEPPGAKQNILKTDYITDPDYLGFITFEEPGRLFTYTSSNQESLDSDEVTEMIEKLTELRENPQLWNSIDHNY